MSLSTLGLWGDGDEIFAIEDAFASISLAVPAEDASRWRTVGDLWTSVERIAPEIASSDNQWNAFRAAIAEETAVDWQSIDRNTTLLDGRGHSLAARLRSWIRERLFKDA